MPAGSNKRTETQNREVVTAPLGIELVVFGEGIIKLFKQAPPPAKPAVLVLAASLLALGNVSSKALFAAFPTFPNTLTNPVIDVQTAKAMKYILENLGS